ncbi:hypothetical protein DFJ74DRAFT_680302 [Hyaloraphidium curvatum]|nr:hypothetical protein DFJ74DRAFT_680302 [Hyaloraphidium curvatum]
MAGFASDSEASSIEEGGLAFARAPVLAAPAGDVREPPAGVPPEPAGADAAAAADAVPHGAPSAAGDGAPPGAEDDADASDLDEDSGSDSDCDAFDFRATAALGLKPAAFHEKGGVPTFRPSAAQFADFGAFIRAVEPWGRRRGLVKARSHPPRTRSYI